MQAHVNNAANTVKQLVVRISPVTGTPVIFDALSKSNGQLQAWVGNEEKIVGVDFYSASQPMDDAVAKQVVQAFAEQHNIPLETLVVRHRLPKTNAATISMPRTRKQRKTNDVNMQPGDGKPMRRASDKQEDAQESGQESQQDYRSENEKAGKIDEFSTTVQKMHDAETNKQSEQKATADKPEGAVVTPIRAKRKYTRDEKAKSKRSAAALARYHADIQAASKSSPTIMEPVKTNASPEVVSDAVMELATALAKILKANPDLL